MFHRIPQAIRTATNPHVRRACLSGLCVAGDAVWCMAGAAWRASRWCVVRGAAVAQWAIKFGVIASFVVAILTVVLLDRLFWGVRERKGRRK